MGSAEVLGQFADQLPDLEDTEGRRISINRVFGKDGVAVPGATATETGAASGTVNLDLTALVRQPCCAAGAALTLVLTGVEATVDNVALRVQRI